MDVEVALRLIDDAVFAAVQRHLSAPEVTIVRGTWVRATYDEMAGTSPFSMNYLKRDVGPKFWKLLTKIWSEEVNKSNLQIVIERRTASARGFGGAQSDDAALPMLVPIEGRNTELAQLEQWILRESCSVVTIQGLSGVGKTVLVRQLVEQLQSHFDAIIWRSLHQTPSLDSLLEELSATLPEAPGPAEEPFAAIIRQCCQHRCLLVLDGVEAILQPGQRAGQFLNEYESYADFFRQMSRVAHQSRLVLTTLEIPQALSIQGQIPSFQVLSLAGLSDADAAQLLAHEGLDAQAVEPLIHQYQGHPLALKIIAQRIQALFGGDVDRFLAQNTLLTDELRTLLEKVFCRLTSLEQELLYTLACLSDPPCLATLERELPPQFSRDELLEALDSLRARSLLNIVEDSDPPQFRVVPMVKAYAIADLTHQLRERSDAQQRAPLSLKIPDLKLSAGPEFVHLSQWLTGQIPPDWQPLDRLLTDAAQLVPKLRSLSPLRDQSSIKRIKYLPLAVDTALAPVALLVMITPQAGDQLLMHVQLQPAKTAELPPHLSLRLLDEANSVLREVWSQDHDTFIQLPSFSGKVGEHFSLHVALDDHNCVETFVI